MIDRDRDDQTMTCDRCRDGLGTNFPKTSEGFREMVETAKREGWTIRPGKDGGWVHNCPACGGGAVKGGRESTVEQARRALGLKKP